MDTLGGLVFSAGSCERPRMRSAIALALLASTCAAGCGGGTTPKTPPPAPSTAPSASQGPLPFLAFGARGPDELARAECKSAESLPIVVTRPKTELYDNLRQIDQAVLLAGLGSLGAALLLGLVLARSLGRPLAILAEEASKVAADQARPLRVRGSGEIRDLALAFEKMLEDLAVTRRRLAATSRVAAWREVARRVAHEVKNPLGAIKGAAQLLEEGGPDPNEFIGIILEEVDRLNHVVGSFLDYARPHAGNPVPIDPNAAVRRTVQILQSQPTEGIVFELDLEDDVPRVKVDPEQLRQVIMNLAQNAIQAMDGHGRVTISTALRRTGRAWAATPNGDRNAPLSADAAPRVVEIGVRDTGPGISQKVLENLFVPFFTTKHEGTGLGLAISQSIVQNVGGNIEVHTCVCTAVMVTVVLPAAVSAPPVPWAPDGVVAKAAL